jgi:crossover junction endodeoxyribonuclease RuvC
VTLRILGIDPGLSGAAALYDPVAGTVEAARDFKDITQLSREVHRLARQATFAVIEYVSAMPGQGVVSMFSFGKAAGAAIGAVESAHLPWVDVVPSVWQRWVREHADAPRRLDNPEEGLPARELALQLLGDPVRLLLTRKKDHNTADAALLAVWGLHAASPRLPESASGLGGAQGRSVDELLALQAARPPAAGPRH